MNASLLDVNRTESRCQDLTGGQQIGLRDKDSMWPVVILAILLQLTTVCLNVTVIIRVNRSGQNKAQTRFLLTSMACVDLFVGLAIITYNILNMVFGLRQTFGLAFCDLFNAMDVVLSSASVLHLTGLTVERYIAICHPFRYHKLCSKLRFVVIYMSVWAMLITSACIVFIFRIHTSGLDINVLSCLELNQHACVFVVGKYFVTIGTALTIAIPGILIVFFNVKLFKHVRTLSVRRREMCEATRRPSQGLMGIRVAKTVAILTGSFLVCWLPFTIINVTSAYLSMRPVLSDAFTLALWLGYLNSAVNPALYLIRQGGSCTGKGSSIFRLAYLLTRFLCRLPSKTDTYGLNVSASSSSASHFDFQSITNERPSVEPSNVVYNYSSTIDGPF